MKSSNVHEGVKPKSQFYLAFLGALNVLQLLD
jgi:hypothetical protein